MKKDFVYFIFFCLFSVCFVRAQNPKLQTVAPVFEKDTKCLNPKYLLFEVASQKKQKPALLIYLHGAGGVGNDVMRLQGQVRALLSGIQKFDKEPCYIVVPQCLRTRKSGGRGTWEASDLDLLLKDLHARLRFDTNRIYLTGNSMGGYGSWTWGGQSPQHFAAIAPLVGGTGPGGPKDVTPHLDKWAANLAKVPVYAFVGAQDRVVPAERSQTMVKTIRQAGGTQANIKVYPNEGHNIRNLVYSSKEFYDWMFAQKKK
jgi:predicted peptidase